MSLITLKTDLKSLKFGNDRKGNGSSGLPFIQTPIPDEDSLLTDLSDPIIASGVDSSRILDWFLDFNSPNSLLFLGKQEILARQEAIRPLGISPKRVYNPLTTEAEVAGNFIGLHLDGKGINPFLDDTDKYYCQTKTVYNDKAGNRLNLLYYNKLLEHVPINAGSALAGALEFGIDVIGSDLFSYSGGPQSILGLTNTNIKRVTDTSEWLNVDINNALINYVAWTYDLLNLADTFRNTGVLIDFRQVIAQTTELQPVPDSAVDNILTFTDYGKWNRNTYGLGSPGISGLNRTNFVSGSRDSRSIDQITFKPLYTGSIDNNVDDLVNFYITAIDNDAPGQKDVNVHFRAFIESFDDNYSNEQTSVTYSGRGEHFYTYGSFTRGINMSFKVHAQSKPEINVMYQKLNYIASLIAPDYSNIGFMRGNLIKLTFGDYIHNLPGILTNLSLSIPQEATWDIARNLDGTKDLNSNVLPMLINVGTFTFIPIHNFIPRRVPVDLINQSSYTTGLGSPFISLK